MSQVASAAVSADLAARNLHAALTLLQALVARGLRQLVVCPGSRSAPLAVAAGLLAAQGRLALHTAIDERSAAFFALGLGRASGLPAAVITTSGTAVANLLPAVVEADYGTIPLLLLTADRPGHLKGCGANQTVNQEGFLLANLRWQGCADPAGLAVCSPASLIELAAQALAHSCGTAPGSTLDSKLDPAVAPGPVQLNLPFAEPLHPDAEALASQLLVAGLDPQQAGGLPLVSADLAAAAAPALDPDRPGIVVAGPWRGAPAAWPRFVEALRRWQARSGWPVLADGLSGLRGTPGLEVVAGYDLVGPQLPPALRAQLPALQVLRLGPLPASRRLQGLLEACGGPQGLVSEGDGRPLDPLGRCRWQWSAGLGSWVEAVLGASPGAPSSAVTPAALAEAPGAELAAAWRSWEGTLQHWLDQQLLAPTSPWGEPALARRLARWLPTDRPLVLANSSPVRDWESFTPGHGPARTLLGCRGASGIDGTLSFGCGVAQAAGGAVLLSGDLALLHDSNGWLWRSQLQAPLLVLLIDNGGGGIFEQLPIRLAAAAPLDFERLFAMPQAVDPCALAAAHGVPSRVVGSWPQLQEALAWGLGEPIALVVLRTDRRADALWRQELRRMACALADLP